MSEHLATVTGRPTRRLVRLYGTWAQSGCGLLITGNVMVDRRAVAEPRQVVLQDEHDLQTFRAWASAGSRWLLRYRDRRCAAASRPQQVVVSRVGA